MFAPTLAPRGPLSGDKLFMPGKSLEDYREEHYMSVSEFAEKLGISPHTYKKIVDGSPVRYSIMRRVAEALEVKPGEIAEFARKPADEAGE